MIRLVKVEVRKRSIERQKRRPIGNLLMWHEAPTGRRPCPGETGLNEILGLTHTIFNLGHFDI
jgi:hypothetical protein